MTWPCVLCGGDRAFMFLERRGVPVHQNLPMVSREAARRVRRGDLRLVCCPRCGFVSNAAFDPDLLQYGEGYENDQSLSPHFHDHVDALVDALVDSGAREQFIVEVGCGRGYFLDKLCERGDSRGIGFDPAYRGPDSLAHGRVTFIRDYYGPKYAEIRPDFVVCRHVIEHVPRPLELLGAVHTALGDARAARVAFETPTVEWILEHAVIQDLFYEHCSYFTAESLAFAFRRAGFEPSTVRNLFGGQYLWLEATTSRAGDHDALPPSPDRLVRLASELASREAARLAALSARLQDMRRSGPVAVWGAGAKGATFLDLLDVDGEIVDSVVDINPRKQGRFLPGTGHPIVAPSALAERGARAIIVMNPNYLDEVRAEVARLGLDVALHLEGDT